MCNQGIKFSVITICYNAEETIEYTLKSVEEQTYKNVEYIIVDGLSKDKTMEIVDRYNSIISVKLSEKDNGLYDAMNKGISLATGDYICFLNAGDTFYSKDTLNSINIKANSLRPDVIYGETAIVDSRRTFLRMRRLSVPKKLTWKSFKYGMLVCHQAFFPKRSLVTSYNLHYRFSSDFDWCIRILKRSNSTFNLNETIINYLSEGVTTQNHRASLKERFHIMVEHYGMITTLLSHAYITIRALFHR